jgi:hypothetical protein
VKFAKGSVERLGGGVEDCDLRTFIGECSADGLAKSASAPCDDGDLAGETRISVCHLRILHVQVGAGAAAR